MFGHQVVDFDDEGSAVHVKTADGEGKETVYKCQYLIGADGGRTVA